jgi:azurin
MKRTALLLSCLLLGHRAFAACEIDVEVGDSLEFSTDAIEVERSCKTVTINLTHTGSLPAAAMGHNWVLSSEADVQGIATAGMSAGLEQNYLPTEDNRVIAATPVIGGGESARTEFPISELDPAESYVFFCSFPGHWTVMKGTFALK